MDELRERARAYLAGLEANRLAALALSDQKANEAKRIQARQEGFEAALQILGEHIPADGIATSNAPKQPVRQRRTRRHISELIARELSFSGQAMTARQIAKAIDYNLEGTDVALQRMEKVCQVVRTEGDRWAIGSTAIPQLNGHAVTASDDLS